MENNDNSRKNILSQNFEAKLISQKVTLTSTLPKFQNMHNQFCDCNSQFFVTQAQKILLQYSKLGRLIR